MCQALPVPSGALPMPQFTLITGWNTWGRSLWCQTTCKYHEVSASGPHLARGASKTWWRRRPGQSPGRWGPRSPHNIPPNTSTCDIAWAPYAVRSHSVLFCHSSPTQRKRDQTHWSTSRTWGARWAYRSSYFTILPFSGRRRARRPSPTHASLSLRLVTSGSQTSLSPLSCCDTEELTSHRPRLQSCREHSAQTLSNTIKPQKPLGLVKDEGHVRGDLGGPCPSSSLLRQFYTNSPEVF